VSVKAGVILDGIFDSEPQAQVQISCPVELVPHTAFTILKFTFVVLDVAKSGGWAIEYSGSTPELNSMSDNKVAETITAVEGFVKAVPVYQDLLQPAVREAGKSLETVTKAVNLALAPLRLLVLTGEQLEEYLVRRIC
jgi:hypothetical protein